MRHPFREVYRALGSPVDPDALPKKAAARAVASMLLVLPSNGVITDTAGYQLEIVETGLQTAAMKTSMDPVSWERARVILSDALNVAAPDRELLVREQCSDDPALCAEILDLLDLEDPD